MTTNKPPRRGPVSLDTALPPQNLEAERSVLGGLLLEDSAYDEVADILLPEHFYSDFHQITYAAIRQMVEDGKQVDALTLSEELNGRKQLDELGGPPFIMELMEAVPHAAHVKYYAEIVRDKWMQRSMVQVCTGVLRDCYQGTDKTDQVLEKAERGIFHILESQERSTKISMDEIMMEAIDRINERSGKSGMVCGQTTGFVDLDRLTNGFQRSELVILAARPSMGKTALVCNIAEWVSSQETTTLIFSLEQSKLELAERFICIRARLDGHKVRKGQLEPDERHALLDAASGLSHMPLFIDDKPGRTVTQISAICRRMKRRNKLGLVIIDYLQLIEPEDRKANREQQIAQITRRLKGIAKENDVPVIALSQLNRGVELREDKRPRLADLRESGAIEQDADIVMFLHRPDAYNPEDRAGLAEIVIAKHRSGPTGIVNLAWRKESMRFESMTPEADPSHF